MATYARLLLDSPLESMRILVLVVLLIYCHVEQGDAMSEINRGMNTRIQVNYETEVKY